jgi:hypothetical protein
LGIPGAGVAILGFGGTSGNLVQGNLIGTNKDGTAALGNGWGVLIRDGAADNTIGGTTPEARNLISGNAEGVVLNAAASHNTVAGNYIGTDLSGTAAVGNSIVGINILNGASNNTIGGTTPGAGNLISGNQGLGGVLIPSVGTTGNSVLGNSIFANARLGIDLGDDGVTANDAGDTDTGPNDFQNFPVLTQVTASGGNRTVFGHLKSTPSATFRIEFFANAEYDPSGYGEGQLYLGSVDVTTDASGLASFSFTYASDPARPFLTSTATDAAGNTSEFSGRDLAPVNGVPGPQTTKENGSFTFGAGALSVSDPDNNGADPEQVTLTVSHGTLTLAGLAGLAGSGDGTSALTYTGTLAALNAALAGLTYTPAPGFDGQDTLTLTSSDLVTPELGGPGTASAGVVIAVVDVANPAGLSVGDSSGKEGQAIALLIQASTVDTDGSETLSIQVRGVPATATLSAGTNIGNGIWTLRAEQLNGLTLTTTDDFTATLTVTATATLVGTGDTAATTRTLMVIAANVPPTATLGNTGPIAEGDSVTVSFSDPSDPSSADTAAGFHYSFALAPGDLAGSYATAGTASSASFTFADNGSYTVYGRVFDKDGGSTDYTTVVTVNDVAPTASLSNNGPVHAGSPVTISFAGGSDPSRADSAAGFHYSFALSRAALANSYDAAGPSSSQSLSFDQPGTYTVFGRIFDKDGGFTDYSTTVTVIPKQPPPPVVIPLPLPHEPTPRTPGPDPTTPGASVTEPTAPGTTVTGSLPAGPGRVSTNVGGGDTEPILGLAIAQDTALAPAEAARSELASSSDGASLATPSVNAVLAVEARKESRRGPPGAPPGPDEQSLLQATQVVAATLDGDDSFRLVAFLLGGNPTPGVQASAGGDVLTVASAGPEAGQADAPPPLTRLVRWLAAPAAGTLAATVWLWRRARRRAEEPAEATGPEAVRGGSLP